MVMDAFENYLLVTYRPFDVHIFQVDVLGELSPSSNPSLQVMNKSLLPVHDYINLLYLWNAARH